MIQGASKRCGHHLCEFWCGGWASGYGISATSRLRARAKLTCLCPQKRLQTFPWTLLYSQKQTLKENTWSFFLFLFFLGSWNFCFPDGHPDVSLGPKETQAVPEEILSGGAEKSSYDSYHLLSSSQELEPMCTVQELTQSKWAISFSNQSGSAEELLDIFLRKLTVQDEELLIKWKNVALEALVPAKRYDLIRFSVMELIGKGQENCLYWMLG